MLKITICYKLYREYFLKITSYFICYDVIFLFKKNENPKLDDITRKYGLLKKEKQDYYEYIINSKKDILKKLEKSHNLTLKEQLKTEIMELTKLLEKCRIISTD